GRKRHEYAYNEKGLLKESITYQDIPEEGGLIPVSKMRIHMMLMGTLPCRCFIILHRLELRQKF
ncbi:MAG TPA: hypothetical protein VFD46_09035, partial [Chryseolinea sp.]|nr:hypothetical protein [Chryseolinea sp.]